ncbi:MAG TPA: hypothetical protein VMD74_02910 [Candidatus Methylomirabilis sp.]|nr:hypothetical protein [Candidatus Methylomirabilis sp.]
MIKQPIAISIQSLILNFHVIRVILFDSSPLADQNWIREMYQKVIQAIGLNGGSAYQEFKPANGRQSGERNDCVYSAVMIFPSITVALRLEADMKSLTFIFSSSLVSSHVHLDRAVKSVFPEAFHVTRSDSIHF